MEAATAGRQASSAIPRERALAIALALILLVGALLRLATLTHQSLWLDESLTRNLAMRPLGGMFSGVANQEDTPPFFYLLAWMSTRIFGNGEFGLRIVPALCGIATVWVVYLLGRDLLDRRAGLVAAALAAVSPLLVWYSQEARSYALLVLLTATGLWCALRVVQGRSGLIGWAVASALAILTHYFAIFPVGAQALWLVWAARGGIVPRRRLLVAVTVVAIVFAAIAPMALDQRSSGRAEGILTEPLGQRIFQTPKQLLVGYDAPAVVFLTVMSAALLLVALAGVWRLRNRRRIVAVLLIVVATVGVPVVLALLGEDYLNTRNVLAGLVPVLVLAAVGYCGLERWWSYTAAGVLSLIGLIAAVGVMSNPQYQRTNWRGFNRALGGFGTARALLVSPAHADVALASYRAGVRAAEPSKAIVVGEVDIAGLAVKARPSKPAEPPKPAQPPPPPPGFRSAGFVQTRTYSLYRYRADHPRLVDPARIQPLASAPPAKILLIAPG